MVHCVLQFTLNVNTFYAYLKLRREWLSAVFLLVRFQLKPPLPRQTSFPESRFWLPRYWISEDAHHYGGGLAHVVTTTTQSRPLLLLVTVHTRCCRQSTIHIWVQTTQFVTCHNTICWLWPLTYLAGRLSLQSRCNCELVASNALWLGNVHATYRES